MRLTALLTVAFLVLPALPAGATTFCHEPKYPEETMFPDVECWYSYYPGIEEAKHRGIVSGHPDGMFRPYDGVNRAELTKIAAAATLTESTIDSCVERLGTPFPDVPADSWFAPYVCAAKEAGIVGGYPDGTFRPDWAVSFVEAAKILSVSFSGWQQSPGGEQWYRPYVESLGSKRAIPISIVAFGKALNRGEVAEIAARLAAGAPSAATFTYADLVLLEEDPVALYVSKLDDPTFTASYGEGVWHEAAERLGQIGLPAIAPLIAHLDTDSDEGMAKTAYALLLAAQHESVRSRTGGEMPDEASCEYSFFAPVTEEQRACLTDVWTAWYDRWEGALSGETRVVKLFLVALEDHGRRGRAIGCGDSTVAVERVVAKTPTPLADALRALLEIGGSPTVGDTGLYNALYQSSLELESVIVRDGEADIRLTGEMALGGVCDDPRFLWQITDTALQFPAVSSVVIRVNGEIYDGSQR